MKKIIFAVIISSLHQCFAQESQETLFSFSFWDAEIDTFLSESARTHFIDDDPSLPLKSVTFDLNGDGHKERIVLNEFLCGTGGCPWIILDNTSDPAGFIGAIGGKEIWIDSKKRNGYHLIGSYWKQGADKVSYYSFAFVDGEYKLIQRTDETLHD